MNPQTLIKSILDENRKLLAMVSKEEVDHLIEGLDKADRIFCAAQGRSGYILRSFCMRLMQLGYPSFFVGETITPGIGKRDMLIVLSGSGQTILTQEWVRVAQQQGATTVGVIGIEDSPIGVSSITVSALQQDQRRNFPMGLTASSHLGLCLSRRPLSYLNQSYWHYTRGREVTLKQYWTDTQI
ncbi:MAG: SIS domain-containing protein [Desulfobacterales bacterium]|nr:SIS domain-containing protein [Desulfobacterales bacterium]